MVKVTRAHPENKVWSHTFTPKKEGDMKHRPRVLGDVGCRSSGWTRDFTSTKCTLLLLFTNTQQSFKCSSFIKREEGGERGKLKTKTRRIKQKQTNNPPPKHRKTKQTRETNTSVSLRDNGVDRVTHGLWYVQRLQR